MSRLVPVGITGAKLARPPSPESSPSTLPDAVPVPTGVSRHAGSCVPAAGRVVGDLPGLQWPSAVVETSPQGASGDLFEVISNSLYASCVFVLMCAWGYLALERWDTRPLSLLTTFVFAALMAGLGAIFASFHYYEYSHLLNTAAGRLDAVTAALEFAVLAMGCSACCSKSRRL